MTLAEVRTTLDCEAGGSCAPYGWHLPQRFAPPERDGQARTQWSGDEPRQHHGIGDVRGMTLVEILVAFMLLVLMLLGLAAFSSATLEHWRSGERRKEAYDRAMRAFSALESDLRSAHADARTEMAAGRPLPPAIFRCDELPDGRQILRFVRAAPPDRGGARREDMLVEIAYALDPSARTLYRIRQPFRRGSPRSIFRPGFERETPDAARGWEPVESGILFWRLGFPAGNPSAQPARAWDSLLRPPEPWGRPQSVLPGSVEVEIEVEVAGAEDALARLAEPLDANATRIVLSHAAPLPDPPAHVLVDGEWIRYERAEGFVVYVAAGGRGARGTRPAAHEAGAPVRAGRSFRMLVDIPAGGPP